MRKLKGYQAFDRNAGFCKLCWNWTEERMAMENPVVEKCVDRTDRKVDRNFAAIERPTRSDKTLIAAQDRLSEIIAASKVSNCDNPFLFGQMMHSYGVGYDRKIQYDQGRVLFNESPESIEAQELMLDRIEQRLIDEEWLSRINLSKDTRIGIKPFAARRGDFDSAPVTWSHDYCSDHNIYRSVKSRRRYQNDKKRIADFETEIDAVYRRCIAECIGIHTNDDHQTVRRVAWHNVFSSTSEKIKMLHIQGKRQFEIVIELVEHGVLKAKTGRQVVSNILRRYKKKQDTIDEIKKLKSEGLPEPEIAKKLKISKHTVARLLET
jgi:polyhydroxyalkanoate synthesis regulator phasin